MNFTEGFRTGIVGMGCTSSWGVRGTLFMARAKRLGMGVLKPCGDSRRYDVAVERGGPIRGCK
jgi:hypothetical protein